MTIGVDGLENHPNADISCPVCKGGGLLDDGDNYGTCFVACPCTGVATPAVIEKVVRSYPEMKEYFLVRLDLLVVES